MKKAKVVAKKPAAITNSTEYNTELRRWCIENAIRWPSDGPSYAVQQAGIYGHVPRTDVDVIGRAKKLLDWVTAL